MPLTLSLTLDAETSDALSEYVATNKAASPEALLTDSVLTPFLAGLVTAKRASTVQQIHTATELLPYADRVELAQINLDFITAKLTP